MIKISGPWFKDDTDRTVFLRGVNLSGSTKVPSRPDGATYRTEGFFNHRDVSFVGKPFPLDKADLHYQRLRSWGFNCLRFLITWEAVEHQGPGIYDEEYLDYLFQVVKKAGEHGFYVIVDPHQDVWSRFSGGDGAPGWTLEMVGLDMTHFKETGAAIVHQTHGDPFPRMIWPTNAYKLAAATMFTLFFAGNDFAPKTLIDGIPVQEYLQSHYIKTLKKVADRLKNLDCVIGFDTLNEPQRGYVEVKDLSKFYGEMDIGICPTPWQSMQLGSGFTLKIAHLERSIFGVQRKKSILINPGQEKAWLPGKKCVWQENGVWGLGTDGKPQLLKPDYFSEINNKEVNFVQDYLAPFVKKVVFAIREANPKWLGFIEGEVQQVPPVWPEAAEMNLAYGPHWYDGVLLYLKHYSPFVGFDILKKKIIIGKKNVVNSFKQQLGYAKELSKERLGHIPVLIGEIGIPFDMHKKKAYQTGDFKRHITAMDRCMRALEANLLNFTLWNYTPDNSNARGDLWNDEDLSIYSDDQRSNPNDLNSGGRALEAVVRPCPVYVAGTPQLINFNLKNKTFTFEFKSDPSILTPTIIYLPKLHYPRGVNIEVSDGFFETNSPNQTVTYHPGINEMHQIRFSEFA
jgi:hypothetical protein